MSVPWNAPEHMNQKFEPLQAKRMDVYSFGMLCLWLLFCAEQPKNIRFHSEMATNDSQFVSFEKKDYFHEGNLLRSWKSDREDRLLKWATWLVVKYGCFESEMADNLTQFFQYSLCFDEQKRITDWERLLNLLAPAR